MARDRRRTQYLRACGWTVMRFSGSQINRNATQCAVQVLRSMGIRQSRVITPQYE
ncbi:DUF559 domain-containing protein [Alicyclobacillus fastidiosus]|uniref:DUF559 domain-containing protein n=1 Tax=Alicyclobacillus fastidiosus TaxID=392011 RepID=UPI0024E11560|nr:DUF559 domain-containing protein [Alicyclobacillus fastidiosus]